jgi:hypothetical protein
VLETCFAVGVLTCAGNLFCRRSVDLCWKPVAVGVLTCAGNLSLFCRRSVDLCWKPVAVGVLTCAGMSGGHSWHVVIKVCAAVVE